jgi:ferritin-like protein
MIPKIFPRNLTARADKQIVGNPVTTRLESGVGNCFPGLEFDHRNLDRRFFPGLVFEFTDSGVRLLEVDGNDPDLDPNMRKTLTGATGAKLGQGAWFVNKITQGGKAIPMSQDGADLDLMVAWRLIHSLEGAEVTLELERRPEQAGDRAPTDNVTLTANRRTFVGPTGVISTAYSPGELTQSLCSPWMHDFRDCACFYWASNHPDIVLAEDLPGEPTLPSGAPVNPVRALIPIDWLRSNRSSSAPAKNSEGANRPTQMDHYEINQRWQELAIVLRGREIAGVYQPEQPESANPLATPDDLAAKLAELATLEHAVALEYLYARYSLKHPERLPAGTLKDDITFARHEILLIAVSEMRHMRWANQLIWSLEHDGMLTRKVGPSLGVAPEVPVADDLSRPPQLPQAKGAVQTRPTDLRPLLPEVLQDFISVEQPSGFLDGQYARVLATLREGKYRETLEQLAARIIADGMEHFSRFRQVQVVLKKYEDPKKYLRPVTPAPPEDADGQAALGIYQRILQELEAAYDRGDMEDAAHIAEARRLMFVLSDKAEALAERKLGVPFFPTPVHATAKKRLTRRPA